MIRRPRRDSPSSWPLVRSGGTRYDAFISYSHSADAGFAPSLQRGLRKLAKPWNKRSALRVFLDKTSLSASANLKAHLDGPIGQSRFFVLLASQKAALPQSWVNKEVEYWRDNREMDNFLIAKTDGEISWNEAANDFDWDKTTALPRCLAGSFSSEPNYVDFSAWQSSIEVGDDPAFREAVARIAAPIHGKSMDELVGEDLDQQRRTKRLVRAVVAVLTVLLVFACVAAVIAYQQREAAVAARVQAEKERDRALVALFQSLRLNVGANNNAGSLCLSADSGCVFGSAIDGVTDLEKVPLALGTLDASTWIGAVDKEYMADPSGGQPSSNIFVVASQVGEGRVIGYAHDGFIRDTLVRNCVWGKDLEQCAKAITPDHRADNRTFIDNALRWVMEIAPDDCPADTITVALYEGWEKLSETGEIAELVGQRRWSYKAISTTSDAADLTSQLRCVNALIWGNPWDAISDPVLAAVVSYVADGGGLLLGGLGWSWIGYQNQLLEDYPASRLAAQFGFAFTRDSFQSGATLRLQPPRSVADHNP